MPDSPLLPAGAVLLGCTPRPLALRHPISTAAVPLSAQGLRRLEAARGAAGQPARARVLLLLEHLRGSYDATVLTVYVGLPAGADPAAYPHLVAGSLALFGLSLASLGEGGQPGPGRTALFDVTRQLAGPGAGYIGPEVTVSFLPGYPAAVESDLVIERVSLYLAPPA